jgi:hypothetical protein
MSIAAINWAWQLSLKPTIKLVLMALADAANDECLCWPSVPTLSHKTCMNERSVQRILKALEDGNFIEVQARFRKDGSRTSNKYRLSMTTTTGDKLQPPARRVNHDVVTATSPQDGNSVTLTTTESLINQKEPLQPSNETLKTASACGLYIFPNQLKQEEREVAKLQLDAIDPKLAQEVLDELAYRLNSKKVKGAPLSYLRALITRAKAGQFSPEAGIRVASAREEAKLAQLKNSTDAIKPSNPIDVPKHLAAMHQVLARKSTSKPN